MNPLLIIKGLELLNTTLSDKEDKEEIVKKVFAGVDEARPFWARKTFWFTVIGVAVPIVNKVAGLDLDITEVTATISPLIAFILSEGWRKKN